METQDIFLTIGVLILVVVGWFLHRISVRKEINSGLAKDEAETIAEE